MRLRPNTCKDWKRSTDVPQSAKLPLESAKPSANKRERGERLPPGTPLPGGGVVVPVEHVSYRGPRLKADPKTGKVTVDESDPALAPK
jgi:hypothetical protein